MASYEQMLMMSGTLDTTDVHPGVHRELTAVSPAFEAAEAPPLEGVDDTPVEVEDPESSPQISKEPADSGEQPAAKKRAPVRRAPRTTKKAPGAPVVES